jgi:hypothetical protein
MPKLRSGCMQRYIGVLQKRYNWYRFKFRFKSTLFDDWCWIKMIACLYNIQDAIDSRSYACYYSFSQLYIITFITSSRWRQPPVILVCPLVAGEPHSWAAAAASPNIAFLSHLFSEQWHPQGLGPGTFRRGFGSHVAGWSALYWEWAVSGAVPQSILGRPWLSAFRRRRRFLSHAPRWWLCHTLTPVTPVTNITQVYYTDNTTHRVTHTSQLLDVIYKLRVTQRLQASCKTKPIN